MIIQYDGQFKIGDIYDIKYISKVNSDADCVIQLVSFGIPKDWFVGKVLLDKQPYRIGHIYSFMFRGKIITKL